MFKTIIRPLLLIAVTVPAFANAIIYDNGPASLSSGLTFNLNQINGSFAGITLWVSDTFTIQQGGTPLSSVELAVWIPTVDQLISLNYCISAVDDCSSSVYESGTNVPVTELTTDGTSGSYTLDEFSMPFQGNVYQAGTYWLLLDKAVVTNGGAAYWDINGGSGCTGTGSGTSPLNGCASGAMESVNEQPIATQGSFVDNRSNSFKMLTPEPSSIALVGVGLLLLVGAVHRRRIMFR